MSQQTERWYRHWQASQYGERICVLPYDWLDWLKLRKVQTVSVAFLAKYKSDGEKLPHVYPEQRAEPNFNTEEENTIATDVADLISLAHKEDIEVWAMEVEEALQNCARLKFNQIKELAVAREASRYNLFDLALR